MPEIPKTLADIFAQANAPALQGNHHTPASGFDANTIQAFASGFAAAVQNLSAGLQDPAQIGRELRARAEQLMEMADLCDLVQASRTATSNNPPEPAAKPEAEQTTAPAPQPAA